MSISVYQSKDPSLCCIRTQVRGEPFDYFETHLDLMNLMSLIADLTWEATKMHQRGREAYNAQQRALRPKGSPKPVETSIA